MERFRRNKGPLLLPVLCLAAALLIYLVVNCLWGAASVARQLSLGQQYLTDMNYNAAILAFTTPSAPIPSARRPTLVWPRPTRVPANTSLPDRCWRI